MELTNKQLKELAKTTQYSLGMVKSIYQILLENTDEEDIALLTYEKVQEHLLWMTANQINNIDDYRQMIEDFKSKTDELTSLDNEKVSSEEMRKKLGYNNSEWKKVKELDATMVREMKKLIVEFMAVSIVDGFDVEKLDENPTFKKMDIIWRNFMRDYIIPNYPRAKHSKESRNKLTNLFKVKLVEALKPS